jgi:hypothetical protein
MVGYFHQIGLIVNDFHSFADIPQADAFALVFQGRVIVIIYDSYLKNVTITFAGCLDGYLIGGFVNAVFDGIFEQRLKDHVGYFGFQTVGINLKFGVELLSEAYLLDA